MNFQSWFGESGSECECFPKLVLAGKRVLNDKVVVKYFKYRFLSAKLVFRTYNVIFVLFSDFFVGEFSIRFGNITPSPAQAAVNFVKILIGLYISYPKQHF